MADLDSRLLRQFGYLAYTEGGPVGDTLQNVMSGLLKDGTLAWVQSQGAIYRYSVSSVPDDFPSAISAAGGGSWIQASSSISVEDRFGTEYPSRDIQFSGALVTGSGSNVSVDSGRVDFREYLENAGISDPSAVDCTQVLQDALDESVTLGQVLFLPADTIRLDGELVVSYDSAVCRIQGQSQDQTILQSSGAGECVVRVTGRSVSLIWSDFQINAQDTREAALFVDSGAQVSNVSTIQNVSLRRAGTYGGLTVLGTMLGCGFSNISFSGGRYGVYSEYSPGLQDTRWFKLRISNTVNCGIFLRNYGPGSPDMSFYGMTVEGNRGQAMDVQGGHALVMVSGHTENNVSDDNTDTVPEFEFGGGIVGYVTSPLIGSGTTPPDVTYTGPRWFDSLEIDVLTGGSRGVATFRYRFNGGDWSDTKTTGATVALEKEGSVANFAAGTYDSDNLYTLDSPNVGIVGGPFGTWDQIEVQIVVGGTIGVAEFQRRTITGGVPAAWSANVLTASTVSLGSGVSATFPAGTYETVDNYIFDKQTTRCTVNFYGTRFGAQPAGHTNPRINIQSTHCVPRLDSVTFSSGDSITAANGSSTGSALLLIGLATRPTVTWTGGNARVNTWPSPSGSVTISNANTTSTVTIPTPEHDANYLPLVSVVATTGTPAAGSTNAYVTSRSATDFVINLDAAPGVSNSVTVAWSLQRPAIS
jgi:hypothetical protein